jgi:tRNA-splicing ligase RtcB
LSYQGGNIGKERAVPDKIADDVLSWATDLDEATVAQAATTAAMPFVAKPLALMPDAHLGIGSTVGSVIATTGAIIPSCVGVDIGCGMIAQRLTVTAGDLDPNLDAIHQRIADAVPSGIPNSRNRAAGAHRADRKISDELDGLLSARPDAVDQTKAVTQFATLGSGNHFVEVSADVDTDEAWIVLHSGSRNPGNTVARHHIEAAKGLMADFFIELPDPDLAYLVEGRPEFDAYIEDMLWAQRFAFANRQAMMDAVVDAVSVELDVPTDRLVDGEPVNCHHNYTVREHHRGRDMWITRKGAIQARSGSLGVIPGSMATGSFIVEGLGSAASFHSASHGAGRKLSRSKARRELSPDSLDRAMEGIAWNRQADALLDEHPDAYKDLGEVMDNQRDLVSIRHRLRTILNYKGT